MVFRGYPVDIDWGGEGKFRKKFSVMNFHLMVSSTFFRWVISNTRNAQDIFVNVDVNIIFMHASNFKPDDKPILILIDIGGRPPDMGP